MNINYESIEICIKELLQKEFIKPWIVYRPILVG